jgi:hypothetical protein
VGRRERKRAETLTLLLIQSTGRASTCSTDPEMKYEHPTEEGVAMG